MPGQGRTVARMQPGVTMLQLHAYLATRGLECSFSPGAPTFFLEKGMSAGVRTSLSRARVVGHGSVGGTPLPRHLCLFNCSLSAGALPLLPFLTRA